VDSAVSIPAPGVAVGDLVVVGPPSSSVSLGTVVRFRAAPVSTTVSEAQALVRLCSGPEIWVARGSCRLVADQPRGYTVHSMEEIA
jgi:hypothetical protein